MAKTGPQRYPGASVANCQRPEFQIELVRIRRRPVVLPTPAERLTELPDHTKETAMADRAMPARPNTNPLCVDCRTEPKTKGRSVCRGCNYQRVKAWRLANPGKFAAQVARENAKVTPEVRRRRLLAKKYGITPGHYEEMLQRQGGVCAGCGLPDKENVHGVLAVDHDHETGAVRVLLCNGCNTVLGLVKEDPATMLALIDYLRKSREAT